jgi:hypothetical protein
MAPVFLDTSGLLALLIGGDASHDPAVSVAASLEHRGAPAISTDGAG